MIHPSVHSIASDFDARIETTTERKGNVRNAYGVIPWGGEGKLRKLFHKTAGNHTFYKKSLQKIEIFL